MIGLDTNVLVRYLMRDDPIQTPLADRVVSALTARRPGYLSIVVLVELWWVLGRSYGKPAPERRALYEELLQTDELLIEDAPIVRVALSEVSDGADFADAIICHNAFHAGCKSMVTFDEKAASRAGMTLLR